MPADQVLEVQLQLAELHQVAAPAPGVSKKTLFEPESSWNKPNDGSMVTITVTTKSADGATVYEADKEVSFTTDEEQVRPYLLVFCEFALVLPGQSARDCRQWARK